MIHMINHKCSRMPPPVFAKLPDTDIMWYLRMSNPIFLANFAFIAAHKQNIFGYNSTYTQMIVSAGLEFPQEVQVFVVDNVPAPAAVLEMLLQGTFKAAAVDAACICSTFHLYSAIAKALHNEAHGSMHTKGIYSEIIYCISASK